MNYIEIHTSIEKAFFAEESPQTDYFTPTGIRLNSTETYRQVTDSLEGIKIEDWKVSVMDACSLEPIIDITTSFEVIENFYDKNGLSQVYWGCAYPDTGNREVFLRIEQLIGSTYYTTPYICNDSDLKFSTLFYWFSTPEMWQNIRINTYFYQTLVKDEIATYYELGTQNTVTVSNKPSEFKVYKTGFLSNNFLLKMRDMFNQLSIYRDTGRVYLLESFTLPDINLDNNGAETKYNLCVTDELIIFPPSILPDFSNLDFLSTDFLT